MAAADRSSLALYNIWGHRRRICPARMTLIQLQGMKDIIVLRYARSPRQVQCTSDIWSTTLFLVLVSSLLLSYLPFLFPSPGVGDQQRRKYPTFDVKSSMAMEVPIEKSS